MEAGVGFVGGVDDGFEGEGDVGDAVFEFGDGVVETLDFGFGVGEEEVEEVGQFPGVVEVDAEDFAALLEEDGGAGVFEDGVGEGVFLLDFLGDFGIEVGGGIFGFPEAAAVVELVAESGVGDDGVGVDLDALFGDEGPAEGAGGGFEEGLEGGAEGEFVGDEEGGEVLEGGVVGLEGFVGGFDGCARGGGHSYWPWEEAWGICSRKGGACKGARCQGERIWQIRLVSGG